MKNGLHPIRQVLILSLLASSIFSLKVFDINNNISIEASLNKKDQEISFKVTMKKYGYVGIGFGKQMRNTDMIIVKSMKSNTFDVEDRYSQTRQGEPELDTLINGGGKGKDDIIGKKMSNSKDGFAVIEFRRKLLTDDEYDFQIEKLDEKIQLCFTWLDGDEAIFEYHGNHKNFSTMSINSLTGAIDFGDVEDTYSFYDVHGMGQLIFWTLINTIGFIAMKHFKFVWIAKYIHSICCGLASLSTIVLGTMALNDEYDEEFDFSDSRHVHKLFGVIILGLTVCQVCLGIVNYIFIYVMKQTTDFIHSFKWVHYVIGYILSFILHICTITGFAILYEEYIIFTYFLAVIFPLTIIIFDIHHLIHNYKKGYNHNIHIQEYERKYEQLPQMSIDEVETLGDRKLVLLDNLVCDITDFLNSHPGGANNIIPFMGKDMSRYLTGTFAPHADFKLHKHKFQTIRYAIENFAVGKLYDNHKVAVSIVGENRGRSAYPNCSFERKLVKEISKDTYKIEFQCRFKGFRFAVGLPGTNFIGRHYSVTSKKMNKTRFYSICFILNSRVNFVHRQLMDYILSTNIDLNSSMPDLSIPLESRSIEFHLKKYYNPDSMSYHLTSKDEDYIHDLKIHGPIGIGLSLPKRIEGTYVAIAGGSGVFCFADFVAFTLRYMSYLINKDNIEIFPNEDFSFVSKDFKLIYFSSFKDEGESVLNDFCAKMKEIDEKYELNVFEFYPRLSAVDKFRWDYRYMDSKIKQPKSITKIFLCGPQRLVDSMNKIFEDMSLLDKVLMV